MEAKTALRGSLLRAISQDRLTNHVLVISRWRIEPEDVERLEQLRHLRLTILVTWSGIDDRSIEPVDSNVAASSLATLATGAVRTKRILYWRPLIAGLNDSSAHIDRARTLARFADATVFTGLFYRVQIKGYLRSIGVEDLYTGTPRRKILPREVERRVLEGFGHAPLFRKTSCAVAFAHATPDYNGHFGIERICDICPAKQVAICAASYTQPDRPTVETLAQLAEVDVAGIEIRADHILVDGSTEQQRYFMQHSLGYQVHDRAYPHLPGRHGRAEEGWE